MLDLHENAVLERLIDRAAHGDPAAQRLYFEMQYRDRPVTLDIQNIETAAEASATNALVIAAVANGEITSTQGAKYQLNDLIADQVDREC